jgi:hypothetical protein
MSFNYHQCGNDDSNYFLEVHNNNTDLATYSLIMLKAAPMQTKYPLLIQSNNIRIIQTCVDKILLWRNWLPSNLNTCVDKILLWMHVNNK